MRRSRYGVECENSPATSERQLRTRQCAAPPDSDQLDIDWMLSRNRSVKYVSSSISFVSMRSDSPLFPKPNQALRVAVSPRSSRLTYKNSCAGSLSSRGSNALKLQ